MIQVGSAFNMFVYKARKFRFFPILQVVLGAMQMQSTGACFTSPRGKSAVKRGENFRGGDPDMAERPKQNVSSWESWLIRSPHTRKIASSTLAEDTRGGPAARQIFFAQEDIFLHIRGGPVARLIFLRMRTSFCTSEADP